MTSVTNGAFIVSNCARFDSAPTLTVVFPESSPPTSAGRLMYATHDGHLIVHFLQVFELLMKALHVFFLILPDMQDIVVQALIGGF